MATPRPVDDTGAPLDADRLITEGGDPPSTRRPLSRDLIVHTAVVYIEEFGLPALTMRHLGEALGVEAMALYRYVPSREHLLDAVVSYIVDEMRSDPDVLDVPQDGWQDFLQRLAHGVRRMALAHPKSFPLVASRPPEAPWLRPPLRSLEWVERFLQGMTAEGFSDEAATRAYRSFTSFLLGHLLLEVSSLGADVGPLDVLENPRAQDDASPDDELDAFPAVARLSQSLARNEPVVEFEESLENLLERMATLDRDA